MHIINQYIYNPMAKITLKSTLEELETAKENVRWLLDNSEGSVDMHGIEYWAGRVERLRELVKNSI